MQEEVSSFKMENCAQGLNRISSKQKHLSPAAICYVRCCTWRGQKAMHKQCILKHVNHELQHFKPSAYVSNNCCIIIALCFQSCSLSASFLFFSSVSLHYKSRWDKVMSQIKTSYMFLCKFPLPLSKSCFRLTCFRAITSSILNHHCLL